jgi:hypothetical protein
MPFIVVDKVDLVQEACWVNHWNNEKRYPFAGEFLAIHDNKQHRPHCCWFYDEGHRQAWHYYFGYGRISPSSPKVSRRE